MTNAELERRLEEELRRGFQAVASRPAPPSPRYRAPRASMWARLALPSRVALGTGAALLLGSGGVTVAAAAAGANPVTFSSAVVTCAGHWDVLGQCMSDAVQVSREAPPASSASVPQLTADAHGAAVPTVAHPAAPVPSHGQVVSAVAREAQPPASASLIDDRGRGDDNHGGQGNGPVPAASREGSASHENGSTSDSPASAEGNGGHGGDGEFQPNGDRVAGAADDNGSPSDGPAGGSRIDNGGPAGNADGNGPASSRSDTGQGNGGNDRGRGGAGAANRVQAGQPSAGASPSAVDRGRR
ncbi:MAG TPA: hypothetical protein VFS62_00250 [Chloroflexota bacterium]|nr:hypothetical protein [Chloroflexota bacterium]